MKGRGVKKQAHKGRFESDTCEICDAIKLEVSWWVYDTQLDDISKGWWVCENCFTDHINDEGIN